MTGDGELASEVKRDWRGAALSERQRALLEFASLVNRDTHAVSKATLDAMRARGFTDAELLDVVHVVGFFNYYTRLADALGVDPEDSSGIRDQGSGIGDGDSGP